MTDILYRIYILYRNIVQFFYVKIQLSSGYISTVICKIYLLKGVNSMNGCPITDPAIAYKNEELEFFFQMTKNRVQGDVYCGYALSVKTYMCFTANASPWA